MFERIGCKGAVDAVTAIINGTRVNSKWSSYDMLILILDSSNINWISHQLNSPCGMLVGTWMTKRNGITRYMGKYQVRADTMAKEALQYWVDSGRQRISTTPVPGTPWTISIFGERTITSKIRSEIQYTNQYGHHNSRNTGANGCINTSNMSNNPDRLDHIRENNEILRR